MSFFVVLCRSLSFFVVLAALLGRVASAQEVCPGTLIERARSEVAAANGIAFSQAVMTEQSSTAFPETRAPRSCNYKIVDVVHQTVAERNYTIAGVPVDLDKAWLKEKLLYRKKYGRLNPALWAHIQQLRPEDVVTVGFFLDVPQTKRPEFVEDPPLAEVLRLEKALELEYQTTTAEVTHPFADAVATGSPSGTARTYVGAPFVAVDLRAADVSLWSNYTDVLEVYWLADGSVPRWVQLYNVHQISTAVDFVHRTLTGTGQGVTVYEFGRLSTNNSHVPFVRTLPSADLETAPDKVNHATSVIGILRTDQPTCEPGYLKAGDLFLTGQRSNSSNFLYPDLVTEAIGAGARVHSFSLGGSPDFFDFGAGPVPLPDGKIYELGRLLDDASINRFVTAVAAVGNSRNEVDPRTGALGYWEGKAFDPATAYQVIAVGGTWTRGTVDLSDDVIYAFPNSSLPGFRPQGSSYKNPTGRSDDREKPEIVAPAVVPSINDNAIPLPQFSLFTGTSMAAPAVAGGAALLMQKRPILRLWPEAVRASLIAGAFHNIEGRLQRSEHDGAGAVRFEKSVEAANSLVVNALPFCSQINKIAFAAARQYTGTGRRVRVALAFNSPTNYVDYTLQPAADLDLLVWRILPNGTEEFFGSSQAWDGTFESVDFVPAPGTFTYRVDVVRWRCEASPRSFSLAFAEE